jgi:hypothetical protein
MNRRILLQVATPTLLLGLLLCAACLGSAWYVNRPQAALAAQGHSMDARAWG